MPSGFHNLCKAGALAGILEDLESKAWCLLKDQSSIVKTYWGDPAPQAPKTPGSNKALTAVETQRLFVKNLDAYTSFGA